MHNRKKGDSFIPTLNRSIVFLLFVVWNVLRTLSSHFDRRKVVWYKSMEEKTGERKRRTQAIFGWTQGVFCFLLSLVESNSLVKPSKARARAAHSSASNSIVKFWLLSSLIGRRVRGQRHNNNKKTWDLMVNLNCDEESAIIFFCWTFKWCGSKLHEKSSLGLARERIDWWTYVFLCLVLIWDTTTVGVYSRYP